MRALVLVLGIPLLSGCASTSPPAIYKPKESAVSHTITARSNLLGGGNGTIEVFIDGDPVIKDRLPVVLSGVRIARGTWKGKPVEAHYAPIGGGLIDSYTMTVFVSGEMAAQLVF